MNRYALATAVAALVLGGVSSAHAAGATGSTGTTGVSGATTPGVPVVTISPLPRTPDASPQTQVSFLGVPASDIHDVVVVGSRSGHHSGRLAYYSTHTGGSFLPSTPFTPGEHVTVSATVTVAGQSERVGTSFDVAVPYTLPTPAPLHTVAETATNVQRFHSRPDLVPPAVSITNAAADPSLGDIFVGPNSGPGSPGPLILSPTGSVVWFHPLTLKTRAFDFNVQTYQGQPVLTWWQGLTTQLHGQGVDEIYSDHYTPVATVRAGNGLYADLHDFQITPAGTAFITAYAPIHWDLRSYGGSRNGLIDDGVIQEIDIKTGLVMFQWNALAHVPISNTYTAIPHLSSDVLDYFHPNSIDPLADGNILISSRNTWAAYLLNGTTGAVIWELGGKKSSFTLGTGVRFAWQHDAEMQPDGTITLFDNEDYPQEASQSRALQLALNLQTMTATVARQLTFPEAGVLSDSEGDVQALANGDLLVGWGQIGRVSEFSPAGQLTFNLNLTSPTSSYRAYRYPWSGQPVNAPALVASTLPGGQMQLYMSWNGATDVANWTVLAGSSPSTLVPVGTYPNAGFETAATVTSAGPYALVEAIGANGQVLHSSGVVRAAALGH